MIMDGAQLSLPLDTDSPSERLPVLQKSRDQVPHMMGFVLAGCSSPRIMAKISLLQLDR